MIDLHLHSIYSDGTNTPKELVEQGVRLGLRAIALTDHDTVNGIDELSAAAKEQRMDFIPGVELSAGTLQTSVRQPVDRRSDKHVINTSGIKYLDLLIIASFFSSNSRR